MFKSRLMKLTTLSFILLAGSILTACEGEEGPNGSSSGGGSTHNAGRDCSQSGCHTSLKYAGTIYNAISGGSAGASVVVTEADGTTISMLSDRNGVFYSDSGNPSGGYTVGITGNNINMVQTAFSGGCSTSGCHDKITTPVVSTN